MSTAPFASRCLAAGLSALLLAPGHMAMADISQFGQWRYVSDQVMGGVSVGRAELTSEGLRLLGAVSTENNGGFIQVRTEMEPPEQGAEGVRIDVRGDGQTYFIHLRTADTRLPWHYYQAPFTAGPNWTEVSLKWADFKASGRLVTSQIDPSTIRSIGLVAYGRDHDADVWLRAITPF